jgi:hypothetical protein
MEKQELLEMFHRMTAPANEVGVRYITESGFLMIADMISSKAYHKGMMAGFDEMENALNLIPLANEIDK